MKMAPGLRKIALTAHVTASVGWFGAVVSFLALGIVGLASQEPDVVRGVYLALNVIGQFVIVPLSFAALLTGLVQSLGTDWGLFRYYWVLAKLGLTLGATFLLLLHQFTVVAEAARRVAAAPTGTRPDAGSLGTQLVLDAGLGGLVLLGITVLSIFKPGGKTPYGHSQPQAEEGRIARVAGDDRTTGKIVPVGFKILLGVLGLIAVTVIALHLAGGGLRHHGH